MAKTIDHLNEEGTRELIKWTDEQLSNINDYTTGINLLRGTRDFDEPTENISTNPKVGVDGWNLATGAASAFEIVKDTDGFSVLRGTSNTTETWNAYNSSGVKGLEPNTFVTLSFEFMISQTAIANLQVGAWYFYDETNARISYSNIFTHQLDNPYQYKNLVPGVWYPAKLTIPVPATMTKDSYFFIALSVNFVGSISYKKATLNKGKINNPQWATNPFDIDRINDITTAPNLLRGTRDFIVGTKKFNNYICSDGFYLQNNPNVYVDDDGFSVVYCTTLQQSAWTSHIPGLSKGDKITASMYVMFDDTTSLANQALLSFVVRNKDWSESKQTSSYRFSDLVSAYKTIEAGKWYKIVLHATINIDLQEGDLCFAYTGIDTTLIAHGVRFKFFYACPGYVEHPEWTPSPFDYVSSYDWNNGIPALLGVRKQIASGESIDDYTTPGSFAASSNAIAISLKGIPEGLDRAFNLDVEYSMGIANSSYLRQRIILISSADEYIRDKAGSNWNPWRKTYGNTTIRPYEGGGTNANSLSGAKSNLGITALEGKVDSINDYTTGLNLIRGSRDFKVISSVNTEAGRVDGFVNQNNVFTFYIDDEGYTVASVSRKLGESTSYLYTNCLAKDFKATDKFTISFEVMIDDVKEFTSSVIGGFTVRNSSGTNRQNVSFVKTDIPNLESGKWYKFVKTVNAGVDYEEGDTVFAYFVAAAPCSLHYRQPMAQRGKINHPLYAPNPNDVDFINDETTGINLLRGTRDWAIHAGASVPNNTEGFSYNADNFVVSDALGGRKIITFNKSLSGLTYLNSSVVRGLQQGKTYTLSYDVIFHEQPGSINLFGFAHRNSANVSKKTVNYSVSNLGTIELEKWYRVVLPVTITDTVDPSDYFFFSMGLQKANVSFTPLCLYEGNINNPIWSASPFDAAQQVEIAQIPKYIGPLLASQRIPANSDMNEYITPGTYYLFQNSEIDSLENKPPLKIAFNLDVVYTNGAYKDFIRQIATEFLTPFNQVDRYSNDGGVTWTEWRQTYTNTTIRPIEGGGTGGITARSAQNNILGDMREVSATPSGDAQVVFYDTGHNDTNGAVARRTLDNVWNWIASKIRNVFGFTSDNKLPVSMIDGGIKPQIKLYLVNSIYTEGTLKSNIEKNKFGTMDVWTWDGYYPDEIKRFKIIRIDIIDCMEENGTEQILVVNPYVTGDKNFECTVYNTSDSDMTTNSRYRLNFVVWYIV